MLRSAHLEDLKQNIAEPLAKQHRNSGKVLASHCSPVAVLRTRHSLVTSSMKEDAMMRSDVPRQMRSKMRWTQCECRLENWEHIAFGQKFLWVS